MHIETERKFLVVSDAFKQEAEQVVDKFLCE